MAVEWKNPPPVATGRSCHKWSLIADELRDHPNEWAMVCNDSALSFGTHLRKGKAQGWVAGDFEVRTVRRDAARSRGEIYARFVGGA